MARTIVKAKTSRVHGTTGAPSSDASAYGRDLETWPRSWMGIDKDLPPGEQQLTCVRPFIKQLASSSLSPKTIRKDNLWLLGGEIIRDLNDDPALRKLTADRLLRDAVHVDGGGPLIHNGEEKTQRSFDSTCRKLYRFLS